MVKLDTEVGMKIGLYVCVGFSTGFWFRLLLEENGMSVSYRVVVRVLLQVWNVVT